MVKAKAPRFEVLELSEQEREAFLERVRPGCVVGEADYRLIEGMARGLPQVLALIEQKDMSLGGLRRLLFGARSEKTRVVCPPPSPQTGADPAAKPKRKGHGRHGVANYPGAQRVQVPHAELHAGAACPQCHQGRLYLLRQPGVLLRITAHPPLSARLFEQEKLRCKLCGHVFTAPAPAEVGTQKYDESVGALVALLRYGSGVPFYRLAQLQKSLGVPLAESVQWEQVEALSRVATPVWDHLIGCAAQQDIVHNDDTGMRVASLRQELNSREPTDPDPLGPRTGIFTSGIVACGAEHAIALFFTGRQHAGENLDRVLKRRGKDRPPPIQMCDGLSRNEPKEFQTLLANCIPHGRRYFVDTAPNFPDECRHVLERLREVYRNDARAKADRLSPQQRLEYHQLLSKPVLDELHTWLKTQFKEKKVEPNSSLGQAINYLLKRWEPLTLFLRVPGAPLDNNLVERTLKMAILHRKNSLSYKTSHGAKVGDLFMSLIHTTRLNGANPFEYLVALARHPHEVAENPGRWLPWNYREALAAADTS
jgi:transposase